MSSTRRPGHTWVSTLRVGGEWPRDAMVQGLLHVSAEPALWRLRDYRNPFITIGRTGIVQITSDPALARYQCLLNLDGSRVTIYHDSRAENPTSVNGVLVTSDGAVMHPGYLIRAGSTKVLSLGPWTPDIPLPIAATDRHEFVELAVAWYGSIARAARALDMDRSTLRRHLSATSTGRALLDAREELSAKVKELRSVPEGIDDGRAIPTAVDDNPWNRIH